MSLKAVEFSIDSLEGCVNFGCVEAREKNPPDLTRDSIDGQME